MNLDHMKDLPKVFDSEFVRFDTTKMRMVLIENAPEWAIQEYNEFWAKHDQPPNEDGNVLT